MSTVLTNFVVGAAIPDADVNGLASSKTVATSIRHITGLRVSLVVSGTYNGDVYCYLTHNSGHVVLLNRVGRRADGLLGYGDPGLNVTFDDAAANGDIHNYRLTLNGSHDTALGGALSGVWAPDGRTNNPAGVLDTDSRNSSLSSFAGTDPNGEWTLFVADLDSGELQTLETWGLEIAGYTAPAITVQPMGQTAECGTGVATFTVAASGTEPLSYQWLHNGSALGDATNSLLTVGNVSAAQGGTYEVIVTNSYGAVTSAVAVLTVADTAAPVVTLNGAASMTVECHGTFADPGATALDACAGSLAVDVAGTVDVNTPGSYTLTYSVSDAAGNLGTASRTVLVQDTTPPVVSCSTNLSVFTTNSEGTTIAFSVSASDLCSGTASIFCTPASGSLFPIGITAVNCTATDAVNNSAVCSFDVQVLLNHAPMAGPNNLGMVQDSTQTMLVQKLLNNDSDEDGDPLSILSVNPSSTNGGTVSLSGSTITYSPTTGFVGTDLFTYVLSDGKGGLSTGSVLVFVRSNLEESLNRIGGLTVTANGVKITFAGIPTYSYTVQRSTDMASWSSIGTLTVPENGIAEFEDTNPSQGAAFYRTVAP